MVSYLRFGLSQWDQIDSGTTIHVVCPTQPRPCLLLKSPMIWQAWYWPHKPKHSVSSIRRIEKHIWNHIAMKNPNRDGTPWQPQYVILTTKVNRERDMVKKRAQLIARRLRQRGSCSKPQRAPCAVSMLPRLCWNTSAHLIRWGWHIPGSLDRYEGLWESYSNTPIYFIDNIR